VVALAAADPRDFQTRDSEELLWQALSPDLFVGVLPIFLLGSLALIMPGTEDFTNLSRIFAWIYGGLILRTVVFFGCAWIFMNLFRGEMVDRSLHYYFSLGSTRDVLVVGKYLSGLVTAMILFVTVTVVSMLLLYLPHFSGERARFFF